MNDDKHPIKRDLETGNHTTAIDKGPMPDFKARHMRPSTMSSVNEDRGDQVPAPTDVEAPPIDSKSLEAPPVLEESGSVNHGDDEEQAHSSREPTASGEARPPTAPSSDELVEAEPVDENAADDDDDDDDVDDNEAPQLVTAEVLEQRPLWKRRIAQFGLLLALVGLAVAIGLGVGLSSRPSTVGFSTSSPSMAPTMTPTITASPTTSPAMERLQIMLPAYTLEALREPDTPQSSALAWLSSEDGFNRYSDLQLRQRFALATFFYATGGENWLVNTGWLSPTSECDWYFHPSVIATCSGDIDEEFVFRRLGLVANGLDGTLPSELAILSNVDAILLQNNRDLVGNVPSSLNSLTELTILRLSGNGLTGAFPLTLVDIALQEIDLSSNRLTGSLPPQMSNLTSMFRLALAENDFEGPLPEQLSDMTLLERFDVSDNRLSGPVPLSFQKLTNLQWLDLDLNAFKGTIADDLVESWKSLAFFDCSDCRLSGTISSHFGSIKGLGLLQARNNEFSGPLPSELGLLTSLLGLVLTENRLSSTIPSEFSNMRTVNYLQLAQNRLNGTIPDLGGLTGVTQVLLSNNNLTGSLGDWITSLAELQMLDLSVNNLHFTIPDTIGQLKKLEILYIADNQLFGTIPASLGSAANLQLLRLDNLEGGGNRLSGSLPSELGRMTNLQGSRIVFG